jgi:ABC-type phosphate transport system permease subunit
MIVLCAVCFRAAANPAMSDSLNAGILVLLGVTGVVLGCFSLFFVRLALRARAADRGGEPLLEDTLALPLAPESVLQK